MLGRGPFDGTGGGVCCGLAFSSLLALIGLIAGIGGPTVTPDDPLGIPAGSGGGAECGTPPGGEAAASLACAAAAACAAFSRSTSACLSFCDCRGSASAIPSLAMKRGLNSSQKGPLGGRWPSVTAMSSRVLMSHMEPFLPPAPLSSHMSLGSYLEGTTQRRGMQRTISTGGSSADVVPIMPMAT